MLQGRLRVLGLVATALTLAMAAPALAAPTEAPFSVVFGIDQRHAPALVHAVAPRHTGNILTFDPKGADTTEPTLYTEFKPQAPSQKSTPRVPGFLRPALKLLHLLTANRL